MKPQVLIGIILIIVGVLIFAYQGITYTRRTRVAKIGPVEVTGEKRETLPISPAIGTLATAGGIFLVVLGSRKS